MPAQHRRDRLCVLLAVSGAFLTPSHLIRKRWIGTHAPARARVAPRPARPPVRPGRRPAQPTLLAGSPPPTSPACSSLLSFPSLSFPERKGHLSLKSRPLPLPPCSLALLRLLPRPPLVLAAGHIGATPAAGPSFSSGASRWAVAWDLPRSVPPFGGRFERRGGAGPWSGRRGDGSGSGSGSGGGEWFLVAEGRGYFIHGCLVGEGRRRPRAREAFMG